ncbi:hypothetical protein GN956_G19978 [Arapaima gigas]
MAAVPPAERASGSRHHGKDARRERSPGRSAGPGAGAGAAARGRAVNKGGEATRKPTDEGDLWEPRAAVGNLPAGKRQVIEKFFTPVHEPQQGQHHHLPRRSRPRGHRPPHRGQDQGGPRYRPLEGSSGHVEQVSGPEELRCPPPRYQSSLDMTSPAPPPRSLDTQGSGSSVSSTASSSWSSEASVDSETFLREKRPAPRHSLSCTNIPSGRPGWDAEEEAEQGATGGAPRQQLGRNGRVPAEKNYHLNEGQSSFPKLQRGQSKSEERLLRDDASGDAGSPRRGHSPLYKSASLGRSLAFSDSAEILLGSRTRKKSVSSVQLPSKGILKNKQGQGPGAAGTGNVRKAKSMEVLSAHVEWTGPLPEAVNARQEDRDLNKRKEAARRSLFEEKLQFSAFLNEITRRVISPLRLSSLGVTDACEPSRLSPASSKHPKEVRSQQARRSEEATSQRPPRQQLDSPDSRASNVQFPPDHRSLCNKWRHENDTQSETTHSQRSAPGSNTDASTSTESLGQRRHPRRSDRPHTEAASSGSEMSPPLLRQPPQQALQGAPHSSPSDTPWSRDRGSALFPSLGHSERRKEAKARHRVVGSSTSSSRFLQEHNEELQRSFLQAVVRTECLEAELHKTHEELGLLKEKFRRLQHSYSDTQETNHLLGEKLCTVVRTLAVEREGLLTHISELSVQLAAARTTIFSLETINVPSLLRELLEKHFRSEEAVKEFLLRSTREQSEGPAAADQSQNTQKEEPPRKDEAPRRSPAPEPGPGQQRVTAFLPWKQEWERWVKSETESGAEISSRQQCQPPLQAPCLQCPTRPEARLNPAPDFGLAALKAIASSLMEDTYRAPVGCQNPPVRASSASLEEIRFPSAQLQSVQEQAENRPGSATAARPISQLLEAGAAGDSKDDIALSWRVRSSKAPSGASRRDVELSTGTVTYRQAQKMLDDFMYQLQHPAEGAGRGGHFGGRSSCPAEEVLNGEQTQLYTERPVAASFSSLFERPAGGNGLRSSCRPTGRLVLTFTCKVLQSGSELSAAAHSLSSSTSSDLLQKNHLLLDSTSRFSLLPPL